MKKFAALLLACASSFASFNAFANSCPLDMKAIDAKLASSPTLAAADQAKVTTLRADGEKFHKAGDHAASMKALGEAKKLLGI